MSTVSGEESVRTNPAPRRTRPGLRDRRLVLLCKNEHLVPSNEKQQIDGLFSNWRCARCGTIYRKWEWICAPLWKEGLEWILWAANSIRRKYSQARTEQGKL